MKLERRDQGPSDQTELFQISKMNLSQKERPGLHDEIRNYAHFDTGAKPEL